MRLIDADELAKQAYTIVEDGEIQDEVVALTDVEEAPTVDPVKHGRWVIRPDDGTAECSECRRIMFLPMRCIENPAEIPYRYCDMCGAKMDEVRE